ncbi:MAG TPA: hypothetical protein VNP96_03675 [Solirubrobacterales bacterium]|nr:hypothetical protein [Solirubrobacterales bacterium]
MVVAAWTVMSASTASALPAATAQWGDGQTGQPMEPRNVGIQGSVTALDLPLGEAVCDASGNLALLPEGRGAITSLELDPKSCLLSGVLEGCVVTSGGAVDNWPIVASKESIVVGDFNLSVVFAGGCNWTGSYKTEALDDWESAVGSYGISEVPSLEGEVKVTAPNSQEIFMPYQSGDLEITGEDSGLISLVSPPFATFDPFWTRDGAILDEAAGTEFVGRFEFVNEELGRATCDVSLHAVFNPGDSGSVDEGSVESCTGVSGVFKELFASCEDLWLEPEALPWGLQAEASTVDLGYFDIYLDSNECLDMIAWAEHLKLTPIEAGLMVALEASGNGVFQILGWDFEVEVSGTLVETGTDAFGIS